MALHQPRVGLINRALAEGAQSEWGKSLLAKVMDRVQAVVKTGAPDNTLESCAQEGDEDDDEDNDEGSDEYDEGFVGSEDILQLRGDVDAAVEDLLAQAY